MKKMFIISKVILKRMIFRQLKKTFQKKNDSNSEKLSPIENYNYNMCLGELNLKKGDPQKRVPRIQEYLDFQEKVCAKKLSTEGRETLNEENLYKEFPISKYVKNFFQENPSYIGKNDLYYIDVLPEPIDYNGLVPNPEQSPEIDIISNFVQNDLGIFLASHPSTTSFNQNSNIKTYPMSTWGATEDISRILFDQLMEDEEKLSKLQENIDEVKQKIEEIEKFHKLSPNKPHNYSKISSKMNAVDLKYFNEYYNSLREQKENTESKLKNIKEMGELQNKLYELKNYKDYSSGRVVNLTRDQEKKFNYLKKNPLNENIKKKIEFNQYKIDGSKKRYNELVPQYEKTYKNFINKRKKFEGLPIPLNVSLNGNKVTIKKTPENKFISEKGNATINNVKIALENQKMINRKKKLAQNLIEAIKKRNLNMNSLKNAQTIQLNQSKIDILYQKYKTYKDEYDKKMTEYKLKHFYFTPYLINEMDQQDFLKIKDAVEVPMKRYLERMQRQGKWSNENVSNFIKDTKSSTFDQRVEYLVKKKFITQKDAQNMKAVPIKKAEDEKLAYKVLRDKKTLSQGQYNLIKKEFGLEKKGFFYGGFIETAIIGSYFVASIIAIIVIIFTIFKKIFSIYVSYLMMRCRKNMLTMESSEVFKMFIEENYENLFFSFLFFISEVVIGSIFFFAPIGLVKNVVNVLLTLVYKPTQARLKTKTNVSKSLGNRLGSALATVLNPKTTVSYVYAIATQESSETWGQTIKRYTKETKEFATCAVEHSLGKNVRQKELNRLKKEIDLRRAQREKELSGESGSITQPIYMLVGRVIQKKLIEPVKYLGAIIDTEKYYEFDVVDIKSGKQKLMGKIKINALYADNVYLKYNTDLEKKSSGFFPNYKDLSDKFFKMAGVTKDNVKKTVVEFYQISIEYFKKNYAIKK